MTNHANRISNANKFEMAQAVRAEGRDPIAERRAMLNEIQALHNGPETDRRFLPGWWILPAALFGLALIVSVSAWVALRLPLWAVLLLASGVVTMGGAALVALAWALGPRY